MKNRNLRQSNIFTMVLSDDRAFAAFILVLLCYSSFCECFSPNCRAPVSTIHRNLHDLVSAPLARCHAKKRHPEYTVVGEDYEDDDEATMGVKYGGGEIVINLEPSEIEHSSSGDDSHHRKSQPLEYAALRPGTVVQVQIGDLSLARKAWKKRRRTGSPLLVPCSVLNVDRRSAVRWNLIFLLEKFGQAGRGKKGGIIMSLKDLARSYRTYLKSSLARQAEALGFESTQVMLRELFGKKIQESYGVYIEEKMEHSNEDSEKKSARTMLYLTAPVTRRKAQKRSANAAMLQFRPPQEGDYDDADRQGVTSDSDASYGVSINNIGTLIHTGWIRTLEEDHGHAQGEGGEQKLHRKYSNLPLSACLRVSQKDDLDTGRVQEGKIFPAVVFDFEKIGDGGSPLLTLSLNAASGGRQHLKIRPDRNQKVLKQKPKYQFNELSVGDGPYRAKVIKLVGNKQQALVDLGVGRELSSAGGNAVKVLGTLRYKDSVELLEEQNAEKPISFVEFDDEDNGDIDDLIEMSLDELDALDEDDNVDEEDGLIDELLSLRKGSFEPGTFEEGEVEEDISEHYAIGENGELVCKNPETGQTAVIEPEVGVDEEEDDFDDEEEDNGMSDDDDDDISDEDMASLFTENKDGSVAFNDPETGETMIVSEGDAEYQSMMMMKSLIDDELDTKIHDNSMISLEMVEKSEENKPQSSAVSDRKPKFRSKRLKVGECIEVYISSVSKQSNQFRVTTNPLVKGKTAKHIKKEEGATKKLNRLKKSFGGNLKRIYALRGVECEGIVKAASKTGDWVYVQPELENLPVGIGAMASKDLNDLKAGENVRVRISGIDEERGQLSMEVISRLES